MKRQSAVVIALAMALVGAGPSAAAQRENGLWDVYDRALRGAKYIELTHTLTPQIPVWKGFGPSAFSPAVNPETGAPYTYARDGFEATAYRLSTDQFGTQLDPPAHWAPEYAAIDELPPTFAVRPLVVISIVPQVMRDFNYHLQVSDIHRFEREHGRIPPGSVVFVRSDWSKRWPDPGLAQLTEFPGVSLDALKFLHLKRRILFHGHEPLDTDSTPTLEGEDCSCTTATRRPRGSRTSRGCRRAAAWSRSASRGSAAGLAAMPGMSRYARPARAAASGSARCPSPRFKGTSSHFTWDASLGMRVR